MENEIEADPAIVVDDEETSMWDGSSPLYATFARRLNAICIDALVLIVLSTSLFVLLFLLERIEAARVGLVVLWWLTLLFYEPLLVWRIGATVGHSAMNLHVVDNSTDRSISLPKAVLRFWLKVLLGWLSFLSMNFSRRHQAVHDIVVNSSVRIRDAAKAQRYHYTLGSTVAPNKALQQTPQTR